MHSQYVIKLGSTQPSAVGPYIVNGLTESFKQPFLFLDYIATYRHEVVVVPI